MNKVISYLLLVVGFVVIATSHVQGFEGIYTNTEFGSESRLYMCQVPCVTATGKTCYEGAYTKNKSSTDKQQALVGIVVGSATSDKVFTGVWVEAGGNFGEMKLNQLDNGSFTGFYRFIDGYNNVDTQIEWNENRLSDKATPEQCYAYQGSRISSPFSGLLSSGGSIPYVYKVCNSGEDDALVGSVYTAPSTSGTQSGKLIQFNGNYIWAGAFADRTAGSVISFKNGNGGSFIYKTVTETSVLGTDWYEDEGRYTETPLETFRLSEEANMTMQYQNYKYDECYEANSPTSFWIGTHEDPNYGGRTYLCPQANNVVVGSYNYGFESFSSSSSFPSEVSAGKKARMIGYYKGEPSTDDSKFSGTWFEPDSDLNKETGVFEWTKINSTHYSTKWWYGSDKSKTPESEGTGQRVGLGFSDDTCHVIADSKTFDASGLYTNSWTISVGSSSKIKGVNSETKGTIEGVSFLNGNLIMGKYSESGKTGVTILRRPKATNAVMLDGVRWKSADGTYSDNTFDGSFGVIQTSTNSATATSVNYLLVVAIALIAIVFGQ